MFIDWHCHILPGLDDGPTTVEESVEMAVALQKAGFNTIYCTPHFLRGAFEADNARILASVAELQARLYLENIALKLQPGREYYLDDSLLDSLKNPLPLGVTKYIMLELPNQIQEEIVKETCFRIRCNGMIPMIAHPERCMLFEPYQTPSLHFIKFKQRYSKPVEQTLLDYLQDIGCAFQADLGSFAARYGSKVQKTANYFKKKGVFTHFGTDAHSLQDITRLTCPSADGDVMQ